METDKTNFNDLLKQAQQMQQKLQEAQKSIESLVVIGQAGAGLVTAEVNGRHQVLKIKIDDSVLKERTEQPPAATQTQATGNKWAALHNQKEVLEDLIVAAINDAVHKIEKASREQMAMLA